MGGCVGGLREFDFRNLRCAADAISVDLLLLCTDSLATTLIVSLMNDAIDALLAAADPAADAPMLADLPEAELAAHSGQSRLRRGCPAPSRFEPCSLCAPMCGASLCVGAPRVSLGSGPRVDSSGWPACELCGRRLSKVKHHRAHGAGRACHPQCKPKKRAIEEEDEVQPPCKRPARAASDPGEHAFAVQQSSTRRVSVSGPSTVASKQCWT